AHQVAVSNPPPRGGTRAPVGFTVTPAVVNPRPSIAVVTPSSLPTSSVDLQVSITGADFISASSAVIGSQDIPTSYVSPNQLLAIVPAAYLSSPGMLPVAVFNP